MDAIVEHINSTGYAFVEFALPMLVQSSVLIVVLLLTDMLLRKKVKAVFRYWIWMLVLAKLILPTSLSSPLSLGRLFGEKLTYRKLAQTTSSLDSARLAPADTSPIVDLIQIQPNEYAQPTVPVIPGVEPTVTELPGSPAVSVTPLSWQGVMFIVWLAVVIAMGLLLLQRALFVRGLVAQAKEASCLMNDELAYCHTSMRMKRKVGLKVSPNATTPSVCGLIRPVILVPWNLVSTLGASRLRTVLMHELAHIKRADLWVNLAQTILQIIYFYNPLLWLANCIIRRIREQAVDEAVLVAMGDRAQRYPQTLVDVAKLAFKRPALSLRLIGVVESKSALAGRIKHILGRPMPKSAKLGIVGVLAVFISAAVLLPMAKGREAAFAGQGGPLNIRLAGVRPDGSDDLYDGSGNKIAKNTFANIAMRWDEDTQHRTFIFELPITGEPILFPPFLKIKPTGAKHGFGTGQRPLLYYSAGKLTYRVGVNFPRTYKKVFGRRVNKVDLTLQYYYGQRGAADFVFTGPFTAGKTVKADRDADCELMATKDRLEFSNHPTALFRISSKTRFDSDSVLVYDTYGRRYLPESGGGGSGSYGSNYHFRAEGLTLNSISYVTVGEKPYEAVFKNVVVSYPDRPARDRMEFLDEMCERLDLTGLSGDQLFDYKFGNPADAIKVIDIVRGRWFVMQVFNAIMYSKPKIELSSLDPQTQQKLRSAAARWAAAGHPDVRAMGIRLGLVGGWPEFMDMALQWLEQDVIVYDMTNRAYRGLEEGAKDEIAREIARYPAGLNSEQAERVKRIILGTDHPLVRVRLFQLFWRADKDITFQICRDLVQDDRPWIWWPAMYSLSNRCNEKLRPLENLPEKMQKRKILVHKAGGGSSRLFDVSSSGRDYDTVAKEAYSMLPAMFTARLARMNSSVCHGVRGVMVKHLDREIAARAMTDFLREISAGPYPSLWVGDSYYFGTCCATAYCITRHINSLYDVNIANLGKYETREKSGDVPRNISQLKQLIAATLQWYDGRSGAGNESGVATEIGAANKAGHSPFAATLPNGVTVELVGLHYGGTIEPSWRPDGSLRKELSYDEIPSKGTKEDELEQQIYDLVIRLGNLKEGANTKWEAVPGGHPYGGQYPRKYGRMQKDFRFRTLKLPKSVRTIKLRLGVASDSWETLASFEPYNIGSLAEDMIVMPYGMPLRKNQSGITVTHAIEDHATRVVAIDRNGRIRERSGGMSFGNGKLRQMNVSFDLPTEQIKEFRFQTRPYEWVTFKNVSLRPGVKTDVQVEPEKTPRTVFTATLSNGVTVELLGICEHPSVGIQWWQPDGGLLEEAPYDDDFGRAFPQDGEKGYKFAVKYSGLAGKEVDARVIPTDFKTTNGGALFSTSKKNGKENVKYVEGLLDEKIVWLGAAFGEKLGRCDIRIGVCWGDWKRDYRYKTDQPNDIVEWVEFKKVSLRSGVKTDVSVEADNPRTAISAIIKQLKSAKYAHSGRGSADVVEIESSSSYLSSTRTEKILDFRFEGELSRSDAFTSEKGKRGDFECSWAVGPMSSVRYNAGEKATVQARPFGRFHRRLGYDFHPQTFPRIFQTSIAEFLERMVKQPQVTLKVTRESKDVIRIVSEYKKEKSEQKLVMLLIKGADDMRLSSWEFTAKDSTEDGTGSRRSRLRLKWRKYAGLWYISEAISEGAGVHDGLRSEGRTTVTIREFTPNIEIGDKEFTLDGLDIRPGARVNDLILDTTYKYAGSKGDAADKLRKLSRAAQMYANDYDNKFPDTMQQLKRFLDEKELKWLSENVCYLGKGKTVVDLPEIPLAYDKTMFEAEHGKGTNVLFVSGIVSFRAREQLKKLGITAGTKSDVPVEAEPRISRLITALYNEKYVHIREPIIQMVEEIGHKEPISFLTEQLKSENRTRRCNAALCLELLGDRRGVPTIIKELNDITYRPIQDTIIRSDSPENLKRKFEKRQIIQDRYYAALLLGILGDERALPALIEATWDETINYRAAMSLGEIGDKRAVPALRAMLDRLNKPFPRLFAGYGLAMLADEKGLKVVIDTLSNHQLQWTVRRHAIEALGKLRDERAVPHLIVALKDDHQNIRVSAARALGAISDSALPALEEALKDNTETKVNAPTTVSKAAAEAITQIKAGDSRKSNVKVETEEAEANSVTPAWKPFPYKQIEAKGVEAVSGESEVTADEPTPRITFESLVCDLGQVAPRTKNVCEFKFTNTGNALLVITRVSAACACTASIPQKKKEYAPGESGTLKVTYQSSARAGRVSKSVFVYNNTSVNPVKLTIKAEIVVKVKHEPERLNLLLDKENAGCPAITLTSLDNQPFSITDFKSTGNSITADYVPSAKETSFVLQPRVDIEELRKGLKGNIEISLTHPECKKVTILYDTLGKFRVDPRIIYVRNAEPQKPVTKKLWIFSNYNEDFQIESTSSKKNAVKVLGKKEVRNGYQFELEITPPTPESKRRVFTDKFSVKIKGGEELQVTCYGIYSRKAAGPSEDSARRTDMEAKAEPSAAFVEPVTAEPKTQEPEKTRGWITGTVVNSVTGGPIAGAYVGVGDFGDSGGSNYSRHRSQGFHDKTETDEKGRFELDGLVFTDKNPELDYHPLIVTHPDFVRHDEKIKLLKNKPEPDVKVSLRPAATIDVTVVDADGNPLKGHWLLRLEALDGRRFIPPGSDPHLSSFASSIWAHWPDMRRNMGTSEGFTFTELDTGEYSIEAIRIHLVDKPTPQNIWEPTVTYHGLIPSLEIQVGQKKQIQLQPKDHQTRLTITPPDCPEVLLEKLKRSSQMPLMCLISRSPGMMLWDDGKIRHLEDQRLGRIDQKRFFRGFFSQGKPLTINNLPPGPYSFFTLAVYGNVAGYLIGARANLDKGDNITVDIPWRQPTGPSMFGPNRSFDYPVKFEDRDYSTSELCKILTDITLSNPRIIADSSIENEKLRFGKGEMSIWDVLEELYLNKGWKVDEGEEKTLIIRPGIKTDEWISAGDLVARIIESERKIRDLQLHMTCTIPARNRTFYEYDWGYKVGKEFYSGTENIRDSRTNIYKAVKVTRTFDGQNEWHLRVSSKDKQPHGAIFKPSFTNFRGMMTFNTLLGFDAKGRSRLSFGEAIAQAESISVKDKVEFIDGHPCYVIEAINVEQDPSVKWTYDVRAWIDYKRDYRLLKFEKYRSISGKNRFKVVSRRVDNIKLKQIDGIWLPIEGSRTTFSTNDIDPPKGMSLARFAALSAQEQERVGVFKLTPMLPPRRLEVDVESIKLNKGISPEKFTIAFPKGCEVYNEFTGKRYVVGEPSEREAALSDADWIEQMAGLSVGELIDILRNSSVGKDKKKWFAAVHRLVEIGSAVVPELVAELRQTEKPQTQSKLALTLRAIGDPIAVPGLIDGLGRSGFSSDYGIGNPRTELDMFFKQHQMDPTKKNLGLGRPVREITIALEKLTGHTEGHDHFHAYDLKYNRLGHYIVTPEIRDRQRQHRRQVAERWRKWWQANKDNIKPTETLPKPPAEPKPARSEKLEQMIMAAPEGSLLTLAVVPNVDGSGRQPSLTKEEYQWYLDDLAQNGPFAGSIRGDSYQWSPIKGDPTRFRSLSLSTYKEQNYLLLCARAQYVMVPELEGKGAWGLEKVEATKDENGKPTISIQFDEKGSDLFHQLTRANVGNHLAIAVDDCVLSAPAIEAPLAKRAIITGDFTEPQVPTFVEDLRKGMTPVDQKAIKAMQLIAEAADKLNKQDVAKMGPRQIVENFLIAGLAGLNEKLRWFVRPGSAVDKILDGTDLSKELLDGHKIKVVNVYPGSRDAFVITSDVKDQYGEQLGKFMFYLSNENGNWLIYDLDAGDADRVHENLNEFLSTHSDVQVKGVAEKFSQLMSADLPDSAQNVKFLSGSFEFASKTWIKFDIPLSDLKNLLTKSDILPDFTDLHKNPEIQKKMDAVKSDFNVEWWKSDELESPVCAALIKSNRIKGNPGDWFINILNICCSQLKNNLMRVYISLYSDSPHGIPLINPDIEGEIEDPEVWSQELAGDVFAAVRASDNKKLKALIVDKGLLSTLQGYRRDFDFSFLKKMVHYQKADRCFVIVSPIRHKQVKDSNREIQISFQLEANTWKARSIETTGIGAMDDLLKEEGFNVFSKVEITREFPDTSPIKPANNPTMQVDDEETGEKVSRFIGADLPDSVQDVKFHSGGFSDLDYVTRVYDIFDLVNTALDPNTGKVASYNKDDANDILQHIIDTVEPDSWYQAGGEGSITVYSYYKLVVFQTRKIHQKIEELLGVIRASPSEQGKTKPAIQIESRLLVVSEDFLEDVGLKSNSIYNTDGKFKPAVVESTDSPISETCSFILDDPNVSFLLRAIQANEDSKALITPKVTVIDGKEADFSIHTQVNYISGYAEPNLPSGEPEPKRDFVKIGFGWKVNPKITPDNKHMLLSVDFELSNLLGYEECMYREKYPYKIPQTKVVSTKTRLLVPDGRTVLMGGQKIAAEKDGRKVQKELFVLIKAEKVDVLSNESRPPIDVEGPGKITNIQMQPLSFGPVVNCVVYAIDTEKDSFIDFDTNKLFGTPKNRWLLFDFDVQNLGHRIEWAKKTGADAAVRYSSGGTRLLVMLWSYDIAAKKVEPDDWQNLRPEQAVQYLSKATHFVEDDLGHGDIRQEPPDTTHIFKTREGGVGIIQIVGFTNNPMGVKIRYKMVQKESAGKTDAQVGGLKGAA